MLRNISTLLLLAAFTFACNDEGPIGPEGPRGPQGEPGINGEEAYTFEWEATFQGPDYKVFLSFPDDFNMRISDVVLVYALWDVENVNGEDLEVWRQLPQTIVDANGILQYNFDFTISDVSVFLEADYSPSILGPEFTDDWLLRAVVVRAQFEENGRIASDYSDYNAVMERFGLKVAPVGDQYKNIARPSVEE